MQSILFTKPLKRLPEKLFYKTKTTINNSIHDKNSQPRTYPAFQYTAIDTKTNRYAGKMIAAPMEYANPAQRFYPYKKKYRSFYIHYIKSEEQYQGFGQAFIELAKTESKNYNCEGRVHLIASRIYDRNNPPHIFYKKCGFICKSARINQYLDSCIKLHKQISFYMSDNLDMFLPVESSAHKSISKLSALLNYIKNLI